jgi:hypothetical protein
MAPRTVSLRAGAAGGAETAVDIATALTRNGPGPDVLAPALVRNRRTVLSMNTGAGSQMRDVLCEEVQYRKLDLHVTSWAAAVAAAVQPPAAAAAVAAAGVA